MVAPDLDEARDRDLVLRLGEGDEEAFRDLFRRYGGVAKALATRIVRQPFLAEEIVQEAFLALWRRPDSYRADRGSVRSFLLDDESRVRLIFFAGATPAKNQVGARLEP